MDVSGKTKICGIIGDPVEHTMSPPMQNAAYKKLGLDYIYLPFHVRPEQLAQAVDGLRAVNARGFNVTIPHKVSIIPMLDGLDPQAEKIGAVNTVVNDDGELRGYNTDAPGFLKALLEQGVEPRGKNIVVIGAGGASRAVSYILAENDASLTILNRQLELDWAEDIAELIREDFGKKVRVLELTKDFLADALRGTHILVNATSVGMSPAVDASPVPAELLRPDMYVFDVVYNPVMTRLLREADKAGAHTISGVDMLVWQGVLAFEKWTGHSAPVEIMRKEALKALEKSEKK
jgi:shikimate dehydrogenase